MGLTFFFFDKIKRNFYLHFTYIQTLTLECPQANLKLICLYSTLRQSIVKIDYGMTKK